MANNVLAMCHNYHEINDNTNDSNNSNNDYNDNDIDNNTIWDGGSTAPAKLLIPHRTQDFLGTLERLKRF